MTATTSPQQQIEDLAPWPAPEPTGAALTRHLTVQAFAARCRLHNHPCWKVTAEDDSEGLPAGRYAEALRGRNRDGELAWALYAAALLARRETGRGFDSPLAEVLDRCDDHSEASSELLMDWLGGYGIDAEVIVQAVRAEQGLT